MSDLLKHFDSHKSDKKESHTHVWGGFGHLPALGKDSPALPSLPQAYLPSGIPRLSEPSPEILKAAIRLLQTK